MKTERKNTERKKQRKLKGKKRERKCEGILVRFVRILIEEKKKGLCGGTHDYRNAKHGREKKKLDRKSVV